MPVAHEGDSPAEGPDHPLATSGRMPDSGPRYTETPSDPFAPDAPLIAEPWNAVTASLFVVIVGIWVWRLRGRFRAFPFLCGCLPVLLAGGVGGTLYHALRTSVVFLLFDVVPISILGFAGSLFMASRLPRRVAWRTVGGAALLYLLVNGVFRMMPNQSVKWSVSISYVSLALLVMTPIVLVLIRTRFRHGAWIIVGFLSFIIAWFFRLLDREMGAYLPMGSHWLWHTFGAITTMLVIEYFYRVERDGAQSRMVLPSPVPVPAT